MSLWRDCTFPQPHPQKGRAAFVPGVWLGKDTESDQHFVADSSGVFKTRRVKRHPPSRQADLALLQSVTVRPWDPTGSKAETDGSSTVADASPCGELSTDSTFTPDASPCGELSGASVSMGHRVQLPQQDQASYPVVSPLLLRRRRRMWHSPAALRRCP